MSLNSRFVLSLTFDQMDYEKEEAADALAVANELGVELDVMFAGDDSVLQTQQLMAAMEPKNGKRPLGIIVQPVGTSLPHIARAAAKAKIGWAVLNREAEYLSENQGPGAAPVIAVTTDHTEMGRIQGRQMAALLPQGGNVLYIEGPSMSIAARLRKTGMLETKPLNITLRSIHSQWGRQHAKDAIASWLKLSTFRESKFDLVAAFADVIAMGVRDELTSVPDRVERERWKSLPFLGCDGCRDTGLAWVAQHHMAATVIMPPLAGIALRLLHSAIQGRPVDPKTVIMPQSYPTLEQLENKMLAGAGNKA